LRSNIDPCGATPEVKLSFAFDGCEWDYTLESGQQNQVDIPGLSFGIGPVSAGAVLDYSLTLSKSGSDENFGISLGLDACASVPIFGKECGHDLTSELPFWVINDVEFDIGSFCSGAKAPADGAVIRGGHVEVVQA